MIYVDDEDSSPTLCACYREMRIIESCVFEYSDKYDHLACGGFILESYFLGNPILVKGVWVVVKLTRGF